jgi:hypothetical protein
MRFEARRKSETQPIVQLGSRIPHVSDANTSLTATIRKMADLLDPSSRGGRINRYGCLGTAKPTRRLSTKAIHALLLLYGRQRTVSRGYNRIIWKT